MSYNSPANAQDILGVEVNQAQLDIARSYIDNYSRYRWETTAETIRFSPDVGLPGRIFLNMPIVTFTSLKSIDEENSTETTLTRFQDYNYDKRIGLLFFSDGFWSGFRFTSRLNSFEADYSYGFDNTNENFQKVKFAEAQIALLIKKNPMMFTEVNLSGDTAKFANNPIQKILLQAVPKRIRVQAIGGVGQEARINNLSNRRSLHNGIWEYY